MDKRNVTFRRIRGHIVPIHTKRDIELTPKTAAGAALAGAGVSVAVAAGKKAHALQQASAIYENAARAKQTFRSFGQMDLFRSASVKKLLAKSSQLHRGRNLALIAGGLAGGAAIAAGAHLASQDNPKHPELKKAATLGGGFALGSTAAAAAYYHGLVKPKSFEALKKVINLARNRKTIQYTLKGL